MLRILVVDDDRDMAQMLVDFIANRGDSAVGCNSGGKALSLLQEKPFDIVLTDLKMKGMDGMELLRSIQARHPDVRVIIMTAFGSIDTAVEAIRLGAFDYLTKPFKLDLVAFTLDKAKHTLDLGRENARLKLAVRDHNSFQEIVGRAKSMRELFTLIQRIARSDSYVLISGESGTGKELVAKAIHRESARADKIFLAINCAAIPEELLESELFGSAKGSYTGSVADKKGLFEEANGGSLFLDEIGDMPLRLQTKLLRALQEKQVRRVGESINRPVDARIIAATNQRLAALIREGRFREDLYYRLNVIPIHLPPLRDRPEDIPLLAGVFLEKFDLPGQESKTISREALKLLTRRPWRGNVRELENAIERACVLSVNKVLEPDDFDFTGVSGAEEDLGNLFDEFPTLKEIEEKYIQRVLEHTHFHKERTASILGMNRRTLLRKEKLYQLERPR